MNVDHEDHRRFLRTIKDQFVADLNQHVGFLRQQSQDFSVVENGMAHRQRFNQTASP